AHGIWVQLQIVPEIGVPGNQESWFKTSLDYVRGAGWAILSQIYQPHCQAVTHLPEIDLAAWKAQGFRCERQGNLPDSETLQLP
ncbi:MAG: YdcF family protein, partial [Cyanobacteria bacterium P01_H01_bin.121]